MNTSKLFHFIVMLCSCILVVSSCGDEFEGTEPDTREITLHAHMAEYMNESKTTLSGTSVLWIPGDEIMVYNGEDNHAKFTSTASDTVATTDFQGEFPKPIEYVEDLPDDMATFWAVYPYSAACGCDDGICVDVKVDEEQTAQEGTFASGTFPCIARSNDSYLAFRNVCGGILFTVSQNGIKKVIFEANNHERIAGIVTLYMEAGGEPEMQSAYKCSSSITVTAPGNDYFKPGEKYYIATLPMELRLGYSITFVKDRTKGTYNYDKALEIHRSAFTILEEKDRDAEFETVDLSEDGTANCYLVNDAGKYKFKATVKGGSNLPLDGTPSKAKVLWETFGDDVTPQEGDVINNVSYSDGYVTFSTPTQLKNGNAVIAVIDASRNILWSWHIWVCKDFDPEKTAQVYNNNAGLLMDRNLGATSATPGDVHALGLLYQWGRKDPFLSGISINSGAPAASTISWPEKETSTAYTGTISYAVAHPTTFISLNDYNMDWYFTGSKDTDNTRWQTLDKVKGIYDPCPAGWRVPEGSNDGVWVKALGTLYEFNDGPWDGTNRGMNFGSSNGKPSSMQLGAAASIWYPAAGSLSRYTGALGSVGEIGIYWSCTTYHFYAGELYFGQSGSTRQAAGDERALGNSVRCTKDK